MKLLSFESGDGPRVGAALEEGVLDLTAAFSATHPDLGGVRSLLAVIQSGIDIDARGEESIARLRQSGELRKFVVANPKWLPPILRPSKILALALNFREHIEETNLKFYEEPIVFTKYTSNLLAHEGEI